MFPASLSRVPSMIAVAGIAAAVAGCGASSAPQSAPATRPAANTSSYTAAQLRAALLPAINGARPAVPIESGAYGSLPGVRATKSSLSGVKIIPPRCASATGTGLSSPQFATVPATVATFRLGRDGLSEVLLAPPSSLVATALTDRFPAGCMRYQARVGRHTFTYQITQVKAPTLGDAARELNVRAFAAGSRIQSEDIWTIIYRAHNLVGAITLVGQRTSRQLAESIAQLSYTHAEKALV